MVGSQDSSISVWGLRYWSLERRLYGHSRSIIGLEWVHGLLFSFGRDNTVKIWDPLTDWKEIACIDNIRGRMFSTSKCFEGFVYAGLMDSRVLELNTLKVKQLALSKQTDILRIEAKDVIKHYKGHKGFVFCITASMDCNMLYTGSGDGCICLWQRGDSLKLYQKLEGCSGAITSLCEIVHTKDYSLVVSGSKHGILKLWKVSFTDSNSFCIRTLDLAKTRACRMEDCEILDIVFFENAVFCSCRDGTVHRCTGESLEYSRYCDLGSSPIMTFLSNGTYLFSGDNSAKVQCWTSLDKHKTLKFTGLKSLLSSVKLESLLKVFQSHDIDLISLPLLKDQDYDTLGVSIGSRRILENALSQCFPCHMSLDQEIIHWMRHLIAYPTISIGVDYRKSCWEACSFLESTFTSFGAQVRVTQSRVDHNPHILARFVPLKQSGSTKKVVFYGHYDVQPASHKEWASDPFELMALNGYLYGRGASDNKGPIVSFMLAARDLYEKAVDVEMVLLLDGEEESDSVTGGFYDALQENSDMLSDTDVILTSNTYWIGETQPCLVYGTRGSLNLQLKVSGPRHNLHSGSHGGSLYEPMRDLLSLLSRLQDDSGGITVPGFHENVRPLLEDEMALYSNFDKSVEKYLKSIDIHCPRGKDIAHILMNKWRFPSMSISSIESAFPGSLASASPICRSVQANVSFRLVPDQNMTEISKLTLKYCEEEFAKLGHGNTLEVSLSSSGEWWLGDTSSAYFKAAQDAIRSAWNTDPVLIRHGGTMESTPMLEKTLNAPMIHIPLGQVNDQVHMEDERIRLENLMKGKLVFEHFIMNVSQS